MIKPLEYFFQQHRHTTRRNSPGRVHQSATDVLGRFTEKRSTSPTALRSTHQRPSRPSKGPLTGNSNQDGSLFLHFRVVRRLTCTVCRSRNATCLPVQQVGAQHAQQENSSLSIFGRSRAGSGITRDFKSHRVNASQAGRNDVQECCL